MISMPSSAVTALTSARSISAPVASPPAWAIRSAQVPALAGQRQGAGRVAVELRAAGDQLGHLVRAFADQHPDGLLDAEAGAGDQGVGDVLLDRVALGLHRGDAALGPVGRAGRDLVLGHHDDPAERAGTPAPRSAPRCRSRRRRRRPRSSSPAVRRPAAAAAAGSGGSSGKAGAGRPAWNATSGTMGPCSRMGRRANDLPRRWRAETALVVRRVGGVGVRARGVLAAAPAGGALPDRGGKYAVAGRDGGRGGRPYAGGTGRSRSRGRQRATADGACTSCGRHCSWSRIDLRDAAGRAAGGGGVGTGPLGCALRPVDHRGGAAVAGPAGAGDDHLLRVAG